MPFHVLFSTPQGVHWWMNLSQDALLKSVVVPYINQHTIAVNFNGGRAIMNLGAAVYLRIFKTEKDLASRWWSSPEGQIRRYGIDCTQEVVDQVRLDESPGEVRSLLQAAVGPLLQQVFVVMKLGDRLLDSAYAGAIRPTFERYGYRALRIDEVQDSGRITDQILNEIARSAIILCDLSGERPNCYYEAGFAHALGRNLVLTIRKGDPIHFDLAGYRFVGGTRNRSFATSSTSVCRPWQASGPAIHDSAQQRRALDGLRPRVMPRTSGGSANDVFTSH